MTTLTNVLKASGRFCWRLSPLFRLLSVVIYYIVGVYYYHSTEDWTVIDSVYFVTVSVATIGYGDLHPSSDSGRLFTSFYLIAGLLFVLSAVDELVRHGILKYQSAVMEQLFPDQSLKVHCSPPIKCLFFFISTVTSPFTIGPLCKEADRVGIPSDHASSAGSAVLYAQRGLVRRHGHLLDRGYHDGACSKHFSSYSVPTTHVQLDSSVDLLHIVFYVDNLIQTVGYGDLAETTRSTR